MSNSSATSHIPQLCCEYVWTCRLPLDYASLILACLLFKLAFQLAAVIQYGTIYGHLQQQYSYSDVAIGSGVAVAHILLHCAALSFILIQWILMKIHYVVVMFIVIFNL